MEQLMRSIRDVAVFAWALCGINGNLAAYSHGRPAGEATPPDGLPIWDPNAVHSAYQPPENQAAARWAAVIANANDTAQRPSSPAPPCYPPSYHTPSSYHDSQYPMDTNYTHSATSYTGQQSSYGAGHSSIPQRHYQHSQQQAPLRSPTHRGFPQPPESWRSEPRARSPRQPAVSAGPSADFSTRSAGQASSPQDLTRTWQ